MGLVLGVNANLYYLTTGSRATWNATVTAGCHVGAAPSNLTEIAVIKDITIPIEKEEADVTTRVSQWKATKGTLFNVSVDIPLLYDVANAGVIALQTAFLTGASIAIALLDGDKATAGVYGLWADWEVTKFEKGEMLNDVQTVNVTIKPAYSAVAPEYVKVA